MKARILKLLRWLGITKPIELTEAEIKIIKFCKGQYRSDDRIDYTLGWIEAYKPLHEEIYGWTAQEDPKGYLRCTLNKFFDTYMKIQLDSSGHYRELKEIIGCSLDTSFAKSNEIPILRAIKDLCSAIRHTPVTKNGVPRFKLD